MILFPIAASIIAIGFALMLMYRVRSHPTGSGRQIEIWSAIRQGSAAYLRRQNYTLAPVAGILFLILWRYFDFTIASGFLVGAFASALAGYLGMTTAVEANVRTAEAAKSGLSSAFRVAFLGGSVTGFLVVGLGLLSVSIFYAITRDASALIGLAFGG